MFKKVSFVEILVVLSIILVLFSFSARVTGCSFFIFEKVEFKGKLVKKYNYVKMDQLY